MIVCGATVALLDVLVFLSVLSAAQSGVARQRSFSTSIMLAFPVVANQKKEKDVGESFAVLELCVVLQAG